MKPVAAPVPSFLAKTGHKAMVYREPFGVALIMGPSNGPLLLLIRPAIAALAAGNTCVLKLSEALAATAKLLLELVPKYFDPGAVAAVPGGKEQNTELLKLPFDFIFFTGSTFVGKIVARAAAENLTPVLLELGGMNPALVDETANIPDAAKKIVWGGMAWGGAAYDREHDLLIIPTNRLVAQVRLIPRADFKREQESTARDHDSLRNRSRLPVMGAKTARASQDCTQCAFWFRILIWATRRAR